MITPDRTTLYVASGTGTVTPIDVATKTVGAPITIGHNNNVDGIAITPDGKTVYAANSQGNIGTVTPIDAATKTAGTPIAVGMSTGGIAITPVVPTASPSPTPIPPTSAICGNTGVLSPTGDTCSYSVTGTDLFNPPAGVGLANITVVGAASGLSSSVVGAPPGPGQPGGQTTGSVTVSGKPLQVDVAGIGGSTAPSTSTGCSFPACGGHGGAGGFGGSDGGIPGAPGDASGASGGTNSDNGGNGSGGGGTSDVRASSAGCGNYSCDLGSRILVAGGGGGQGGNSGGSTSGGGAGGVGGGPSGANGTNGTGGRFGSAGTGGTPSQGGAGGINNNGASNNGINGASSSAGDGGQGHGGGAAAGGGGGGGYFGGGGGSGGGSSTGSGGAGAVAAEAAVSWHRRLSAARPRRECLVSSPTRATVRSSSLG